MANHKSALKRHRQSLVRRVRNRGVRTRVRTAVKMARIAIAEQADNTPELIKAATRLLDRAVSKNVLPGKRVGRLKSSLATHLNRLRQSD